MTKTSKLKNKGALLTKKWRDPTSFRQLESGAQLMPHGPVPLSPLSTVLYSLFLGTLCQYGIHISLRLICTSVPTESKNTLLYNRRPRINADKIIYTFLIQLTVWKYVFWLGRFYHMPTSGAGVREALTNTTREEQGYKPRNTG